MRALRCHRTSLFSRSLIMVALGLPASLVSSLAMTYFISVLPIYAEEHEFSSSMRGLVIIRRCELGYDFNIILIVGSYFNPLASLLDTFIRF